MERNKPTAGAVFAALGKALCYLLVFLLCQLVVSAGYSLAVSIYATLNPGAVADPMALIMACTDQISLISGLLTLVLLAAFFLLRRKNPLKESGFHVTRGRSVAWAIALTPLLYAVVIFVIGLLPESWLNDYAEASASLSQTGVLMVIATAVVAPLVEEVVFRGLILSRLRRALPGWLSVVITALVFGLCHGHIVWIIYAFALGCVFGLFALKSGSLWPSLCAHVLFNAIGQLAAYLPEDEETGLLFILILAIVGAVLCAAMGLCTGLRRRKERRSHE